MMRLQSFRPWKPTLAAAAWAVVTAGVGGALTTIGPWYHDLTKPVGQPPDWAFGPAWTLIFTLTAIAGVWAWRDSETARQRRRIIAAFILNGVLNAGWSGLFFTLQRPDWGRIEVVFLWLSVAWMMWVVAPYSRRAMLILIPYLLWVGYASHLNCGVVRLNGPFGG
ncbi:TspO/MBR family protein [Hwanghaeella sp. LZ110]|uniref:TspO/MBR family protein n=1 Tax=Hwanghaeella sp. LZ110 TaxID=3402810 RepID=UPI003B677787